MKNVLKDTASTTGNLASGVGRTGANLASGVGNTTANLASDVGGTTANLASDVGNTTANLATGLGGNTSNLGSGLGSGQTGLGTTGYMTTGSNTGLPYGSAYQSSTSTYQSSGPGQKFQSTTGPSVSNYQQPVGLRSAETFQQQQQQQPGFRSAETFQQQQQPGLRGSESYFNPMAPTVVREHIDRPTIVRETVLPQEKIEVQPVIHREREQLEVHEVVQPMHERDIGPTLVKHATLPAQVRPDVRETDTQFQSMYKEASSRYTPEVHTEPVLREFYNKPAIIEEHISKKIIEEVQPVLYRETVAPVLIEETQPIYERIVETPTIVEELRQPMELGTKIQPLTGQMGQLNLGENQALPQQPTGFQRETFVTKEYIPTEEFSNLKERTQIDTKRNV